MFNACPTFIRRGSKPGFAAISASSFTLYLRAMEEGVSPDRTRWLRAGEFLLATLDEGVRVIGAELASGV